MNTGLMHKLKNWVSGDPFEDELFQYEDEYEAEPRAYRPTPRSEFDAPVDKKPRKNLRVVEHPAGSAMQQQVVVIEPRAFEEALDIIEHLRARRSVLLNLHMLDTAQSQRVVDFLSGATHAIDGNQQRIGDGVFMFTPSNVVITSEAQHKDAASHGLNISDAFWNQGR